MRALLALACAVVAGCRTARPPDPPFTESHATVWDYLQAKYDADGDGAVSLSEYGRGEEAFKRLDRDGDGAIAAADFRQGGGMDQFVAQMTLLRYFQADGDRADLKRAELDEAFARHDGNGDGAIDEGEFTCAAEAVDSAAEDEEPGPARRMPPGMNPFGSLLAMADADGNRALSAPELQAFFDARDDGDGVWTMRPPARRDDEGEGDAAPREAAPPMTGVAEGEPAPDFTLRPPEGGAPVRLSSFRGKRPVALIFGSYT